MTRSAEQSDSRHVHYTEGTKESDGESPKQPRRERSFYEDSPLKPRDSTYKRERTFYRPSQFRDSSPTGTNGGRSQKGRTQSPERNSNLTGSSGSGSGHGTGIKLHELRRSNSFLSSHHKSVATKSTVSSNASSRRNGSIRLGPGSIGTSALSEGAGLPEVPLAESPRITTTAGTFRVNYNDANKLSFRRIVQPEPPVEFVRSREKSFVNDAIVTERRRTRYRDIIPTYDAANDLHSTAYFRRPDVQKLLQTTCTLKPWEKDVKPEYVTSQRDNYY